MEKTVFRIGDRWGWLLVMLLLFLASCDRRELTYYMESEITVPADWSCAGQEEECDYGATLVIYPQDGSRPKVVLMGEREKTTVRLPEGRYDAVLFNRSFSDFGCIIFRGHEILESLEACARQVETRASTRVIVSSPEKLAAATLRDFEVTESMLGNYAPPVSRNTACPAGACAMHFVPAPLTRRIEVELHVDGLNNVREARCTLGGVPFSVFLHDGSVGEELCAQEFRVGNPVLDVDSWQNGTLTGELNVFGFDKDMLHEMKLITLLVDGKTVVERTLQDVRVTESTDGNGVITLSVSAATAEPLPDVKPEGGSDSGFDADVEEWGEETKTEIPI